MEDINTGPEKNSGTPLDSRLGIIPEVVVDCV